MVADIQPVAGQDIRDRQRMGDVGIAVLAPLRSVRLHREHVRGVDQGRVGLRIVGENFLRQLELPDRARAHGRRRLAAGSVVAPEAAPVSGGAIGGAPEARVRARPLSWWATGGGGRRAPPRSPPRNPRETSPRSRAGRFAASSSAVTSCRPKMFWSVGMRSRTSSSAGSGSGAAGERLDEFLLDTLQVDRLFGDLAKRDDRVLVVVAVYGQFLAAAQATGPLRREAGPARSGWEPSERNLRR